MGCWRFPFPGRAGRVYQFGALLESLEGDTLSGYVAGERHSLNGAATVRRKAAWALERGLGGVMLWELGQDDALGSPLLAEVASVAALAPAVGWQPGEQLSDKQAAWLQAQLDAKAVSAKASQDECRRTEARNDARPTSAPSSLMKRNVAEPDSTYRGTGDSDEIAALRAQIEVR